MAEAICQRVREQRAKQKKPTEEASSSSESEEDPVEKLSSSSNPVTISNSSLEGEHEETATPSRPDDDPD